MNNHRVGRAPSTVPETMSALGFGDQFLVWTIRTWAQACRRGGPDAGQDAHQDANHYYTQLRRAFELAGMAETHLVFDRFTTHFTSSLKVHLSLHFQNCIGVSRDEVAFVRLVADMQNGMAPAAFESLAGYLAPAGVRLVMEPLSELAMAFASKGLLLQRHPVPEPRPRSMSRPADDDRPSSDGFSAARSDAGMTIH